MSLLMNLHKRVYTTQHDSLSKLGYERERISKLTQEYFEEVLKKFSFLTYFEGIYHFDKDYINSALKKIKDSFEMKFDNNDLITDLKVGTALWVEDAGIYSFAHRSLQEYFAALYIKDLNSEHKSTVYGKVYNKILERRILEIDNFLSLCEEMDEISYISYFALPVLTNTLKSLRQDSVEQTMKSVLRMILGQIVVSYGGRRPSPKGPGPSTSLHFISESVASFFLSIDPKCNSHRMGVIVQFITSLGTDNIKSLIMKKNIHDDFFTPTLAKYFSDRELGKIYAIDIEQSLDEEFCSSLIAHTDLITAVEKLVKCAEDRIEEYKQVIAQREKSDKELINLI